MNAPNDKKRALGRGLDALLPTKAPSPGGGERSVFLCPIEKIVPQKGQPRQYFDETELEELAQSIKEHGLIEPLVVRRPREGADTFEIIAGERRWRASQRAGLHEVMVVVKDVSPKDAFELALVENVQRSDLNPIETAEAYDRLIREHDYTQEALAARIGKSRPAIANSLRLIALPPNVRARVIARELSEGHARAILGAPSEKAMEDIADKAVRGRLNVRKVEELVRAVKSAGDKDTKKKNGAQEKSSSVRDLEARLMRKLGARVEVMDRGGRGEVVVHYASLDELDRILAAIER